MDIKTAEPKKPTFLETFENYASALAQQQNRSEKYLSVKGENALVLPDEAWDKLSQLVKHADKPDITEKQIGTLLQHRALLSQPESKALFENLLQTRYAKQHNVTATLPKTLEELQKAAPLHLVNVEIQLAEKQAESMKTQGKEQLATIKEANKLEKLKIRIGKRINPPKSISVKEAFRMFRSAINPKTWVRVGWQLAKEAVAAYREARDERLLQAVAKTKDTEKVTAVKNQEKARQSSQEFYEFLSAQQQHGVLRTFPNTNAKTLAELSLDTNDDVNKERILNNIYNLKQTLAY
jgi:hypothetical protein